MSKPRRSSGSWRERQERDPFVQRARREGWRSRAVFKLEEIDRREKLLRPDMVCVDLGAAPGGWSQYVSAKLSGRARIIATDLLPMDALPDVEFLQGDFREDEVFESLLEAVGEFGADLVMSDMAPNITGTKVVDQPRSMYLAELALDMALDGARVVQMAAAFGGVEFMTGGPHEQLLCSSGKTLDYHKAGRQALYRFHNRPTI